MSGASSYKAATRFAATAGDLIGGDAQVRALVDKFYDLMDSTPEFYVIRKLHPADLSGSRDKLTMFLSGWMGFAAVVLRIRVVRSVDVYVVAECRIPAKIVTWEDCCRRGCRGHDIARVLVSTARWGAAVIMCGGSATESATGESGCWK